jgi:hypothetical protein
MERLQQQSSAVQKVVVRGSVTTSHPSARDVRVVDHPGYNTV